MAYSYDQNNIFARILRGEIPNNTVLETEHTLAFRDIAPQAPVHVLIIPKGPYVTYAHFCAEASDAELVDFARVSAKVCADLGVEEQASARLRMRARTVFRKSRITICTSSAVVPWAEWSRKPDRAPNARLKPPAGIF